MNRATWLLITGLQTALVALVVVAMATRGDAAAASRSAPLEADPGRISAQATPPATFSWPVSRQEARVMIEAAIMKAQEFERIMTVAVVDPGGNLISLDRMDGMGPYWDKFAIGKALGSLSTRAPTRDFPALMNERPDRYFGTLSTFAGQFYMVNGGQPLVLNGVIVGAVGVAGLGPGQDDQAIDAGVAAWQTYRAQMGR